MAKEVLEQIFNSPVKVKLLKLFLRNEDQSFTFFEIARRIKSSSSPCKRELKKLHDIRFVVTRRRDKKKIYSVNPYFDFYKELKTLILKSSPTSKKKILKKIRSLGGVKLAIISGVLINAENSRVDIMLVGDNINKRKISNLLADLEADVGKEIDYVILDTAEFDYRYKMFDRFLRDVLEQPHEKLINKLKI
ncbi:winged helix-turn-helix domain-containing protein [Patescibacteria group bacterium]